MLTAMIVDDESTVCDGLQKNIPWERLGIHCVIKKNSAEEALSSPECPDILISDIRMGKISGISLAETMLQRNPECKIIFMSAYSDKEYYRSAIHLHAVGYIEKPIILREAVSVISDAADSCRKRRSFLDRQKNVEEYTKVKFCEELLSGNWTVDWKQEEFAAAFLHCSGFVVLQMSVRPRVMDEAETSRLSKTVQEILRSQFADCLSLPYSQNAVLYILAQPERMNGTTLLLRLRGVMESIPQSRNLFISVGQPVASVENLKESCETAREGEKLLFYKGYGECAAAWDKYGWERAEEFQLQDSFLNEIPEMVRSQRWNDFTWEIRRSIARASRYTVKPPSEIKKEYLKLLLILADAGKTVGKNELDLYQLWKKMESSRTLIGVGDLILSVAEEIFQNSERLLKYGDVIGAVLQELDQQISNADFSIKVLAEEMHFRDTYLISLFKKKTGTTINKYLLGRRMEEARRLLLSSDKSIAEVAGQVGYRDVEYFTRSFRKYFGAAPSEFRGGRKG